jgi:hypothetical protein
MSVVRLRGLALAGCVGLIVSLTLVFVGGATGQRRAQTIRWDIVSLDFAATPPTVSAGGTAGALAQDGSRITFTGSGTFISNPGRGRPQRVTGGGRWTAFDAAGNQTDRGRYRVTGFVSWERAPSEPANVNDRIGRQRDQRAGVAILRIRYSDGERGTLLVSCDLGGNAPDTVFEGITATRGFVAYWNREAPTPPPGNENRTIFHVVR